MDNFQQWPKTDNYQKWPSTDKYKIQLMNFKKESDNLAKKIRNYVEKDVENGFDRPPTNEFWWITLSQTEPYNIPWVEKLTAEKWTIFYENALQINHGEKPKYINHKETYYTDRQFPMTNIEKKVRNILNADRARKNLPKIPENQPVMQYAKDGTIRDINWYIVLASKNDYKTYPRGMLVMTTLGPGRIYDRWWEWFDDNHFDIYTHRPRLDEIKD